MPYKLRKAPNRNLYWVITIETKKKHSKEPIPLEKAKAQMRILESALVGGGPFKEELQARLSLFDKSIKDAVYAQYEPQLDAIKSGVNFFKGRFFRDENKREQKRAIIEAAIADAREVQERRNREKKEEKQRKYEALPWKKVKEGTVDPISYNTIKHGDPISTITEPGRGREKNTFIFETPSLKSWEEQSLLQGRQPSNPSTGLPYNPEQKLDYKARDPKIKPIQQYGTIMGLRFAKPYVPGREQFPLLPSDEDEEKEGEGRHRGKRKCKKCGKLKK